MDTIERHLIELNQILTQCRVSGPVCALEALQIAGAYTTCGSDIINIGSLLPGPPGEPGPPGPPGPKGDPGVCEPCKTVLVSEDYIANADDYYIGVDSDGPVTIFLPPDCEDCGEIIVKAEMGPPLGNRKVTVATLDGSTIDGAADFVLTVPYEYVHVLCRAGNWYIVGRI